MKNTNNRENGMNWREKQQARQAELKARVTPEQRAKFEAKYGVEVASKLYFDERGFLCHENFCVPVKDLDGGARRRAGIDKMPSDAARLAQRRGPVCLLYTSPSPRDS